jgi:hypothetical protein
MPTLSMLRRESAARITDLLIEKSTKFGLVIDLKTAKALGLTIAQWLLLRARPG